MARDCTGPRVCGERWVFSVIQCSALLNNNSDSEMKRHYAECREDTL